MRRNQIWILRARRDHSLGLSLARSGDHVSQDVHAFLNKRCLKILGLFLAVLVSRLFFLMLLFFSFVLLAQLREFDHVLVVGSLFDVLADFCEFGVLIDSLFGFFRKLF